MSLILFEDDHLLVVNKPPGWNTHAPAPCASEGIYDWLKHREPRWTTLAIIHRLDKETSGVLVFGKTPEANRSLAEQFASRAVRKKYLLLTDRPPPSQVLIAKSQIVRAGEKYVSRPLHPGDDEAETHFSLIEVRKNYVLIEAQPITGRTHQIRVHAAEHGFPILGDGLYGGAPAERVFLHAVELSLRHPVTAAALIFRAPDDWTSHVLPPRFPDALRSAVIDAQQTNALRIIHGASDEWPGLFVDKLGDYLLAQSEHELTERQRTKLQNLSETYCSRGTYHKLLSRHVRGSNSANISPRLVFGAAAPERFDVRENGLTFELSFSEGYSVGLFLDQRDNRRRFLVNHIAADFTLFPNGPRGAEMLNAFAYTCGFSVAAAKAGARTVSLDLSRKYLEWGKRNFVLNQIDPVEHDFIYGDTFDWMRRLTKKGRRFDAIALDPPTFSQSKESGTWQAEKNYGHLVESALPLLKPGGVLFASTNAAKMEPEKFLSTVREAIEMSRQKILQQHYVPQPPDFPITRAEPAYLKTAWVRIA